jgi:hypothetical protein
MGSPMTENGDKRSKVLGLCSKLSKGQAEALLSQILRPFNKAAGRPQACFRFKRILRTRFLFGIPTEMEGVNKKHIRTGYQKILDSSIWSVPTECDHERKNATLSQ